MSGIPPLAAFFSKDLILEEEYLAGADILFDMGLLVSVMTAFYLMRAYILTFWGDSHLDSKILRVVKEAPMIMVIPVAILAFLATFGGFLGFSRDMPPPLERFLAHADITFADASLRTGFHLNMETWMSIFGAILGVGSAAYIYLKNLFRDRKPIKLFKNAFYVDQIYDAIFVKPLAAVAHWITGFWEPKVVEGSIYMAGRAVKESAGILQRMQSGQIRSYIAWMTIGMVLSIFYLIY